MMAFRPCMLVGLLLLVALSFREVGAQVLSAPPTAPSNPFPPPLFTVLTPPPPESTPPASPLTPLPPAITPPAAFPPPPPVLVRPPAPTPILSPIPTPAPVHAPKPAPKRAPRRAPAKAPEGFVSQGVNVVPSAASPVGPNAWTGLLLASAFMLILV